MCHGSGVEEAGEGVWLHGEPSTFTQGRGSHLSAVMWPDERVRLFSDTHVQIRLAARGLGKQWVGRTLILIFDLDFEMYL